MAQIHLQIPSFNAGELSPLLGARFAVEKVASGCRKLRNFIPHTHGPVFRRPGFEFLGYSQDADTKSRLFPFSFSTTTGFILEFSEAGLAVWSAGEKVTLQSDVGLPYSEQECTELQIEQVNDVLYIAHQNHPPMTLTRYADDDWRLDEVQWTWPPLLDENVSESESGTPTVTTLVEETGLFDTGHSNSASSFVPAGDWQVVISCTGTPHAGSKLWIQQSTGTGWKNYQAIDFTANAVKVTRMPRLTGAWPFRLHWSVTGASTGTFNGKIQRLEYPDVSLTTLTPSAVNGDGITITSSL